MKRIFYILFFTIASTLYSQFEELPLKRNSSFEGRHFLIGFMQNEIKLINSERFFKIIISSYQKNTVTLTYPDGSEQSIQMNKESSRSIAVTQTYEINNSGKNGNIFEISSMFPVSVYCYNALYPMSSDVFTAIPTKYWGNEYYTVNNGNDYYYGDLSNGLYSEEIRRGEFLIIAKEDNTKINIRLNANSDVAVPATIFLNKNQSYFVKSDASPIKGGSDLTGSRVLSDKPVGVISGHMRGAIPPRYSDLEESKDHLAEMLLPKDKMGQKYYTAPWSYATSGFRHVKSAFKVIPTENNTNLLIRHDGIEENFNLNLNDKFLLIENIQTQAEWIADKKFVLAQFMARDTISKRNMDINVFYDPSYVIISPTDQYVNNILFNTLSKNEFGKVIENSAKDIISNNQYENHYAYILADREAIKTLTIDGNMVDFISPFKKDFGNADYFYSIIELETGTHILKSTEGKFSGVLYGVGQTDSYSHILGSSLISVVDENPPVMDLNFSCSGIYGFITDSISSTDSGVDEINIIEQSNINFTVSERGEDDAYIRFRADAVDRKKDGRLILEFYDHYGNGKKYTYEYKGIDLQFVDGISDIDFGLMLSDDIKSETRYIINKGSGTITIEKVIFNDSRVILNDVLFPYELFPNDTLALNFTFDPNSSRDDLSLYYDVFYDCNARETGKLEAEIVSPDLVGQDKKFNKILVNDIRDGIVSFFNKRQLEITLSHIEYEEQPDFILDTNGLFPFKLIEKFGRLDIPVRFNPNSIGKFELDVVTFTQPITISDKTIILDDSIKVIGEAGSPMFDDIIVDFGRVRLGNSVSKTFDIKNYGSFFADIEFTSNRNINWYKNGITIPNYLEGLNDYYNVDKTTSHTLLFKPTEIGDFNYEVSYTYEFEKDDFRTFTIKVIGEAFSGEVDIKEYCSSVDKINEIKIGSTSLFNYNIASIVGDESTTINRILSSSTTFIDINGNWEVLSVVDDPIDFVPDLSIHDNTVIDKINNQNLNISLEFAPERVGDYIRQVFILNNSGNFDLNEGYSVDTTQICISAYELEPLNYSLEFINTDLQSCIDGTVTARFTNSDISSLPLTIVAYDIETIDMEATLVVPFSEPIDVDMGESIDFDINTNMINGQVGQIIFNLNLLDTLNKRVVEYSETVELSPTTEKLIIDEIKFEMFQMNDTNTLVFNGMFPTKADVYTDMSINLAFDELNFQLLNNGLIFYILDGSGNKDFYNIAANLRNNRLYIEFEDNEFTIPENAQWFLEFQVFILYNIERNVDFSIEIKSDKCFGYQNREIKGTIDEICLFVERFITLANENNFTIFPNPLKDELKVELEIKNESIISIGFYDILGNYYPIVQNKTFEVGNHFIYYDINVVNNGNYLLEMVSGTNRKTKNIIIHK